MTEPRFAGGARVRARRTDPEGHTRLPRYVRGCVGVVHMLQGVHPVPDERALGVASPAREPVYTVLFAAQELWGGEDFEVCVDAWERYLEPADSTSEGS